MRYLLLYTEENISKVKADTIKKIMKDAVIFPVINGEISYVYLREGEAKCEKELTSKYGFYSTRSYETYENVKSFIDRLETSFDVGDVVNLKNFGKLNFTVNSIDNDVVHVTPHLRNVKNIIIVDRSEVKEAVDGKEYSVQFSPNKEILAIDIKYLSKFKTIIDSVESLFVFLLRLKLQFRNTSLAFYGEETPIISDIADFFGFDYLEETPVASYYFSDQTHLVNISETVIQLQNDAMVSIFKSDKDEYMISAVKELVSNGTIKELISSETQAIINSGNPEKILMKLKKYSSNIAEQTEVLKNYPYHYLRPSEIRASVDEFKSFINKNNIAFVLDNVDFYYNAIYK